MASEWAVKWSVLESVQRVERIAREKLLQGDIHSVVKVTRSRGRAQGTEAGQARGLRGQRCRVDWEFVTYCHFLTWTIATIFSLISGGSCYSRGLKPEQWS